MLEREKKTDICNNGNVDAWREVILKDDFGEDTLVDEYIRKEYMKNVEEKTYLGHLVQNNGK